LNGDNYCSINHYHIGNYPEEFQGLFTELKNAMNDGNHDNSDAMVDYFDVGWYVEINIGSWKKPYKKIEFLINKKGRINSPFFID
jgi:hypothetical protein